MRREIQKATLVISALVFGTVGCLKTRAQLRNGTESVPGNVRPVEQDPKVLIEEFRTEVARLGSDMQDYQRQMDEKFDTQNREMQTQLDELSNDVQELKAQNTSLIEELEKLKKDLPAKERKDVYDVAKSNYDKKNYSQAIDKFSDYLRTSGAKKADLALYYRGESYFKTEKYQKAALDFSKIVENYPRSAVIEEAYYKTGLCFESLGLKKEAKPFFEELIHKFPKSSRAKSAKRKLGKK